jgi:calcium/calmodulin-dependent protein kinase I
MWRFATVEPPSALPTSAPPPAGLDLAITQAGPEENEENGLRAVAVPPMGNSFTTAQGASGRDLTPDGLKKCDCFAVGNYTKMRKLGSGAFSTVYLARYNPKSAIVDDVGVCRAIKVIQKEILTPEDKEGLHSEIAILLELKSPLVMALYEVYESPTAYQMVTELIEGGELFERIVEKEKYTEKEARDVVRNMVEAVGYLHKHGVVHRDLKPENILLESSTDDSTIKIADFGFAKHVMEASSACGTPGFVAPEILKGQKYGLGVDVWSLGVIVYIALCGYPPFYDENQAQLFAKIKAGRYSFHKKYWEHISEPAKGFIRAMLTVDPGVVGAGASDKPKASRRWTCAELLEHEWLEAEIGHIDLGHSLKHLRDAHATNDLLFEANHAATGPHANPDEHDDYHNHVEGRPVK